MRQQLPEKIKTRSPERVFTASHTMCNIGCCTWRDKLRSVIDEQKESSMIISYHNIVYRMATISVPLTPELQQFVEKTAHERGSNKAAIVREALQKMEEDMAVQAVLHARTEPTLSGDLHELAQRIV